MIYTFRENYLYQNELVIMVEVWINNYYILFSIVWGTGARKKYLLLE